MATQSPPLSPSTSTPEYLTFKKCYQTIVHHVKQQPGAFCDALFARSYIPPTVRDYTRNDFIGDEAKAHKMVDTLIDQIEHNPSVYHDFIKIAEEFGLWAGTLVTTMKECYENERKPVTLTGITDNNQDSSDDSYYSASDSEQSSIETTFPFLDVTSLTEANKEDLEAQLRADTQNIKMKFSDFSVNCRDSLEQNEVPLDKIKDSILSLDAFTDNIGVKVLDPEDEKKIESATNITKVFTYLRKYVSFFNYEIIRHLIHQYGSRDDKKQLEEYLEAFNTFCQRNVFEVPPKAYSSSRPAAKEFVIKCTEQQLTLQGVQVIRDKVAKVFGLRYSTLQLSSIRKGCVEIHFLISAAVADHIFPVSPAQLSALSEFGVRVLTPQEELESCRLSSMEQTDNTTLMRQVLNTQVKAPGGESESKIRWRETRMITYGAGGLGVTLLITSKPNPGHSDPQVVPRKTQTEPLSEKERAMLEEQGVPRDCQDDDISIMRARYRRFNHSVVQSESTEDVRQQIVKAMEDPENSVVQLHYNGSGKKGTGDWCFSDGFITFRDLMELYTQHFKGRVLSILSDCSYSGSWMREAMALMDEHGVGPCGHTAKEKGVLISVAVSCLANEIPAELAFSTHGVFNIDAGVAFKMDQKINDGQHMRARNFTEIHCKNERIDQPCTMAPGSTWHQLSIQERVFRYNGINNGRLAWYYLLVKDDDEAIWKFRDKTQGENAGKGSVINIEDYGQILKSGWGWEPTFEVKHWIAKNLLVDYDHHPLSDAPN